jgi:glycosyltransferase 2 family protein
MNAMNLRSRKGWVKAALAAVGVLLFLYLIRRIGLETLGANLSRFGPWFFLTCSLAAAWFYCQAWAWWLIQKAFFQQVPLRHLYRIKIITAAFNLVLPAASLGGEAMRAFLVKKHIPLREGIPSVLFDKTIEFIGSMVFLTTGFLLGLVSLRLPTTLIIPVIVSLGLTATGTLLFVVMQKRGVTKTLTRLTERFPKARGWIQKHETQLLALDQNLRVLYTRSNHRALLPIALQILGRLLGTVEIIIIMAVLKSPVTFVQAIVVSSVVTIGNSVFFILPGQWGVMESFYILVLQSMGYPAAVGLSLSVIRRIRNIIFVGVGLALFSLGKRRPAGEEES